LVGNKIINIKKWLENKLYETGAKGFVLGLSGGIDSAVTAIICNLVSKKTLCLIMPCDSNPKDEEDAWLLTKKFNLSAIKVNLTNTYDEIKKDLNEQRVFDGVLPTDLANIKPRLRMIALYYYANKNNYLVVGCSNKTEIQIGYSTKYGDGACDILPIGSLLKKEVYEVANELNIPKEIIEKEPSAGLWEGQTDEGEIGYTYEQIDKFMEMKQKAEHKQQMPEVCK